ncbi:MAG: T9SS type A sorting domain-containing protein [Rhizobacter sp.]|nr:T9SS type A sorting domain-containing protein [Ferruginibacter sp.]
MKKIAAADIILLFVVFVFNTKAQTTLTANGPGNTYELINSVLAPGYNAVEDPECVHPEFGRHIAEVFDTDISQYAFEFYAHVTPDNDRCINFDRQRVEIKTYDASPESLKGRPGEIVNYKWRFKIPVGFKPSSSFTHIHQVKAVGGDEDQPIFTLTVRKGTPNKLELIYVANGTSGTVKYAIVNLAPFEGTWVEATEQVFLSANGFYNIYIKRVSDNATLLSYSNNNISTIRPDNNFVRPKWGIYRSLNTPADLRDESIRFSLFSISEGAVVLPVQLVGFNASQKKAEILLNWTTSSEFNTKTFIVERSADGIRYETLATLPAAGNTQQQKEYSFVDKKPLPTNNYYRLKQTDINDQFVYSDTRLVKFSGNAGNSLHLYPNPVSNKIQLDINSTNRNLLLTVSSSEGKNICNMSGSAGSLNAGVNQQLPNMPAGMYFIQMHDAGVRYVGRFYKQ